MADEDIKQQESGGWNSGNTVLTAAGAAMTVPSILSGLTKMRDKRIVDSYSTRAVQNRLAKYDSRVKGADKLLNTGKVKPRESLWSRIKSKDANGVPKSKPLLDRILNKGVLTAQSVTRQRDKDAIKAARIRNNYKDARTRQMLSKGRMPGHLGLALLGLATMGYGMFARGSNKED